MRRATVALLLAGLLLQAGALWLSGTDDVRQFRTWALTVLDRNFFDAYSYDIVVPPTGVSPIPDYPPLSVAMLAASGQVARWIRPAVTRDSRLLTVCVKAPLLILQIATVWLVFRLASRDPADHTLRPAAAALSFWLNPAFLLNGPVLGYLDLPCWIAGVGAIVAAAADRATLAGALIAASILIKPQGLFFGLPLVAILWTRPAALARAATVCAVLVIVVMLPFLVRTPHGLWISLSSNFSEDMLSGDALNLWWLVSAAGFVWTFGGTSLARPFGAPTISMFVARVGVDPQIWATLAVAGAALWLFWRTKGRANLASAAALGALVIQIYFVCGIAVHENHLVYALPLMGIAALSDRHYRRLYAATSALVVFNLLVMEGLGEDLPRLSRTGLFLPLTVVGALASVFLLARHLQIFRAAAPATAATAPSSGDRAP